VARERRNNSDEHGRAGTPNRRARLWQRGRRAAFLPADLDTARMGRPHGHLVDPWCQVARSELAVVLDPVGPRRVAVGGHTGPQDSICCTERPTAIFPCPRSQRPRPQWWRSASRRSGAIGVSHSPSTGHRHPGSLRPSGRRAEAGERSRRRDWPSERAGVATQVVPRIAGSWVFNLVLSVVLAVMLISFVAYRPASSARRRRRSYLQGRSPAVSLSAAP
jgi:hypothetical protein